MRKHKKISCARSNFDMRTRIQIMGCARAYKFWHAHEYTNFSCARVNKFWHEHSFGIITRIQILEIYDIVWKIFQNCAQAHTNFGVRTRTQILQIFRKIFRIVRTLIQIMACARGHKFWHAQAHTNYGMRIQILACAYKFWHAHTNFGMRTPIQIFKKIVWKIFENC
jgi:hypothetical protein